MPRAVKITAITARLNSNSGKERKFNYYHGRCVMRKFLLYSSALVAGGLLSGGAAEAACIQTPTCSSLGYTSTSSCTGGTKCPFGNYWNCTAADSNNKITELTNKITELETQISELKKEVATSNCLVGDILYSDMSCDPNVIASKKPIGVVFDRRGKAIGLEQPSLQWSTSSFDVPGVDNIASSRLAMTDLDGKKNTSTVLAYCKANGYSCPAFEYVNSYKTEGTKAGDWYLPSMGELYAIYGNRGVLNVALGKIAATRFGASYYWSSSEYSSTGAWWLSFTSGSVGKTSKDNDRYYVRPVLAF